MGTAADVLAFVGGMLLVILVVDSAVRTFVLPRAEVSPLTRIVFIAMRRVFMAASSIWGRTFEARDRVMALYAPLTLLLLPLVWLLIVLAGFTLMLHSAGVAPWRLALDTSGASLLTLGFTHPSGLFATLLTFAEAAVGLVLLALLIAFLPTIYGAFSRREVLVAKLAVRAGDPPTGVALLSRAVAMQRFDLLDEIWQDWQTWFAEVEETHTTFGMLAFFRSPRADRSWLTAAGAVLDGAALRNSVVDGGWAPNAGLCVRAGFVALRAVASYYDIPFDPDPAPSDPISITREEFDAACDELGLRGVRLRDDRDQAWIEFAGWRVNYDQALLGLAGLVLPPYAPWSSDRSLRYRRPRLRARR